jgi:tryptophan synthase alpha chain
MPNRIEARFEQLREKGAAAFIPFITAGDPTLAQTKAILLALEAAGADVIELGIPFSDPVGDGPVIQEASLRALQHGVKLRDVLALVRDLRRESQVPLLLFSYFNPLLAYGVENFARDAAAAGADGVLCVDLPAEEADDYKRALDAHGLCTVFLAAPTTSDARLAAIGQRCTGFVYYVSRLGVTGTRAELVGGLKEAVARIKRFTTKPVAVGFGISTPEHAREVASFAEGVVVGSAIVKLIADLGDTPELAESVRAFAASLAEASKKR